MPNFEGSNVIKYAQRYKHRHQVVLCVSPFYPSCGRGKNMSEFGANLEGFKLAYKFERHKDDLGEDYSCQIRIYDNRT